MSTLSRITSVTRDLEGHLLALSKRPEVQREVEHFRTRIENIKSIDEFLKDDRVFRFAMAAHGLSDMVYAKAFIRKALNEGIDRSDALANKMIDERYRDFVTTFNFQRYGEAATIFDRARQGTIDRYLRQALEENEGAQNDDVRLALYFQRKAPQIDGPFDILSDKALTRFVFQALGLPLTTSMLDIDRQANLLSTRLDFAELKQPEAMSKLIARFAARADAAAGATSSALTLLQGANRTSGIGVDLLLAMQRTKSEVFGR